MNNALKKTRGKILLVRTDNLGDQILTLPVLNALKDFDVTLYVKKGLEEVLGGSSNPPDYRSFDAVLNLPDYEKPALESFLAKIPLRIGLDQHYPRSFLYNKRILPPTIFTHQIEQNLKFLAPLGIDAGTELKLPVPAIDYKIDSSKKLIGISISASGRGKNWHSPGFAKLIDRLSTLENFDIVLIGADSDQKSAGEILRLTGARVINKVGKTSIPELKKLISMLSLHIGTDSGTTHLAAAYQVPALVIYVNKDHSPLRWGPWGTRHLFVINKTKCPKICRPHQCQDLSCEKELSCDDVFEKAKDLLNGKGVAGKTESFLYRAKEGLNILNTATLPPISLFNIKEPVGLMIQNNINLIHDPSNKSGLALKIAAVYYSNLCGKMPAIVNGLPGHSTSEEDLLLFYKERIGI